MKNIKALLFLPLLCSTLMVGCDKKEEEKEPERIDTFVPVIPEIVCTGDKCDRIKTLTLDQKCPFYLKVGETKEVSFSIEGTTKIKDELKIFEWKCNNDDLVDLEVTTTGKKPTLSCKVKAKKSGKAIVTATNTIDPLIVATYTINIIDYKDGDYLWEYSGKSEDKSLFGYVSKDDSPQGKTYGTTDLNGKSWTYDRNRAVYLANAAGSIQFGKGCSFENQNNAEDLTLTLENEENIKCITVETSSANSLCNFKIEVGGEEKLNTLAPARNGNSTTMLTTSDFPSGLSGQVKITWDNPDFDEECLDPASEKYDEFYKGPGAIYLRSIYIQYNN